jgi:hypothetical protein
MDRPPAKVWWLKDQDKSFKDGMWEIPYNRLIKIIEAQENEIMNDNYCISYVNSYNNTIFVVVKSLKKEVTDTFLSEMNPEKKVKIIFREGMASHQELKNWSKIIEKKAQTLKEKGVVVNWIGINENSTISVGLESIDEEKINLLLNELETSVPKGLLTIYPIGKITLYSQSDPFDDAFGGIKMTSYSAYFEEWGATTIGFYVTWSSGAKQGILFSGHAASMETTARKKVYQPTKSAEYYIADTKGITDGTYSDSAYAKLVSGKTGRPNIWSSGVDKNVTGQTNYSNQALGADVEATGRTSGVEIGNITDKGTVTNHPVWGTIYEQVLTDIQMSGGDSGAPVYAIYWEPEPRIYTCSAYGIVSGGVGDPEYMFYSPVDGCETDLGKDFDFADW